jgi:hypothetical protein
MVCLSVRILCVVGLIMDHRYVTGVTEGNPEKRAHIYKNSSGVAFITCFAEFILGGQWLDKKDVFMRP